MRKRRPRLSMMATATQLLYGLDEQRGTLTGVMCGVATEAAQAGIGVRLAHLGVVAPLTPRKDEFRLSARVTFDLLGIAARVYMIRSRTVAALTSAGRRTLALKGLGVRRLLKTVEGVFMAPLADLDADVL